MTKLIVACVGLFTLLAIEHATAGVTLTFDSPVPGTIPDKDGQGTGFTHRLPGTGSSLPTNDLNLDLKTGRLSIASTHADLTDDQGLGIMESLGVFVTGVGSGDIAVSALFRDVELKEGSDQLTLYVGTATNNHIRAGLHRRFTAAIEPQYFIQHRNTSGAETDWRTPGSTEEAWSNGDNIELTLARTNDVWGLSWHNLSNGNQGSTPTFSYPWLDASDDLYFGVYFGSARSASTETSWIDVFSVIPEPSTFALLAMGVLGLAVIRRKPG